MVFSLQHAWESPGGLLSSQISSPTPGASDAVEFTFLMSSQVMLMMLAWGLPFERCCSLALWSLFLNSSLLSWNLVLTPLGLNPTWTNQKDQDTGINLIQLKTLASSLWDFLDTTSPPTLKKTKSFILLYFLECGGELFLLPQCLS